jgi:hypothetical protein
MINGGLCQFRFRKDGQITIHVLLSNRKGSGREMLQILKDKKPTRIVARCPIDYESNGWYEHNGFSLNTNDGKVNTWLMEL